jgi:hypothetical protein
MWHYQIQSEGFGCPSESMITNRNLQIFTRDFFYGIRYLELPVINRIGISFDTQAFEW